MKRILLTVAMIAAMSSCSKNSESEQTPDGRNEISLSANIAGTKAAMGNGSALKEAYFLRVDGSAVPTSFENAATIYGSRATNGAITFGNPQYYLASGNTYFMSYSPNSIRRGNRLLWPVDGQLDILTTPIVADAGSNESPVVANLNYQHELAQLEIKCIAENDAAITRWGGINGIYIITPTHAYYDLATRTMSFENLDIATLRNPQYDEQLYPFKLEKSTGTPTNDPVVAAGMYSPSASQQITLNIRASKITETRTIIVDFGAGNTFERGKKHVVTLTFKEKSSQNEITASSTIEAWQTGATGSGDVN